MTAVKLLIGLAVAGVALFCLMPSSKLREENEALRLQIDQGAEIRAEHDRLSGLIAQTKSSQSLTKEQMRELIRLRGEAGGLRRMTNEIEKLKAANERLLAASKSRTNGPISGATPWSGYTVLSGVVPPVTTPAYYDHYETNDLSRPSVIGSGHSDEQ